MTTTCKIAVKTYDYKFDVFLSFHYLLILVRYYPSTFKHSVYNTLGIPLIVIGDGENRPESSASSNIDTCNPIFLSDLTAEAAVLEFQKQKIDEDLPKQRFTVCRVDGKSELRRDIISIYKKPDLKLCAVPRVRFEEEDGVGSGPVREFLVLAMEVVDEGIPSGSGRSKPLIFFEGQPDHRLPIHDQSLRLTGTFKALGRIIGHSILHGGPGIHGLSPAVKHVLTSDSETYQPPPIVPEDIVDIDLRQMIVHHVSIINCKTLSLGEQNTCCLI